MTVVRYGNDIIVIDSGLAFPEDDMLGIDLVIPDITYLLENRDMVRAIVLTHGHEDHIGALPYVLKQLNVPVYGTRLTLGILEGRLRRTTFPPLRSDPVKPGDQIQIGAFKVGFIKVSHSIPDAVALSIKTPVGTIVHTGDFKLDQTPVDGKVTDFHRFAELGDQGVLVLMADSTNAERPGFTSSERMVGTTFDETFRKARDRIIIATFSSNVHRIQQADRHRLQIQPQSRHPRPQHGQCGQHRHGTGLSDRSGRRTHRRRRNQQLPGIVHCHLTTGSQGEPMSALTRMAMSDHKKVDIVPGDTVIISATPIPGNEKMVSRTIDFLLRQGAEVIYEAASGIHVSGHASQEELKLMHNLVRPQFFIPVHGEYRHLSSTPNWPRELGMPKENIFVAENGHVLEFTADKGAMTGKVTAGKVLVDGLGVGDVGNIVLRDRRQLSQDGILIVVVTMDKQRGCVVAGPDIVSRGFVYVRESEQLMDEARDKVKTGARKMRDKRRHRMGDNQVERPRRPRQVPLRTDPPAADDPADNHGSLDKTRKAGTPQGVPFGICMIAYVLPSAPPY